MTKSLIRRSNISPSLSGEAENGSGWYFGECSIELNFIRVCAAKGKVREGKDHGDAPSHEALGEAAMPLMPPCPEAASRPKP